MADDIEPLFEHDVARAVEKTFDRLVEAWEDLEEADRLLERHRASIGEPQPPSIFESRKQLTDFVRRKQEYDRGLGEVTKAQ